MILAGVPGVNNFEQSGTNSMHQSQILVNNKAPQILSEITQGRYSSVGSRTPCRRGSFFLKDSMILKRFCLWKVYDGSSDASPDQIIC